MADQEQSKRNISNATALALLPKLGSRQDLWMKELMQRAKAAGVHFDPLTHFDVFALHLTDFPERMKSEA